MIYGRVYGWRAMHAVSLGHLDSRPLWLGLEPGRKVRSFPSARFYAKQKFMKKAISAKQKSRGRPATGITPMMGFRADPVIRAEIVRWAENQPDMPTLSEAIRRLVELGLTVKTKGSRYQRGSEAPRPRDGWQGDR
jgi:hypothetical protein